jgi:hypothetical protein
MNWRDTVIACWRLIEQHGGRPTIIASIRMARTAGCAFKDHDARDLLRPFVKAREKRLADTQAKRLVDALVQPDWQKKGPDSAPVAPTTRPAPAAQTPSLRPELAQKTPGLRGRAVKELLVPKAIEPTSPYPSDTTTPALAAAVENQKPTSSKKPRIAIEVPLCDFDFGPAEELVHGMLAIEASNRTDGKIAQNVVNRLRWAMTKAFERFGEAAFVYGLEEALGRGKPAPYAIACMPGYQPGSNVHPLRKRFELPNTSDLLPTGLELVDAGLVEEWVPTIEEIRHRDELDLRFGTTRQPAAQLARAGIQ